MSLLPAIIEIFRPAITAHECFVRFPNDGWWLHSRSPHDAGSGITNGAGLTQSDAICTESFAEVAVSIVQNHKLLKRSSHEARQRVSALARVVFLDLKPGDEKVVAKIVIHIDRVF